MGRHDYGSRRCEVRVSTPGAPQHRVPHGMIDAAAAASAVSSIYFVGRPGMAITFEHVPHPHIAARKKTGPPKTTDESVGFNGKIALGLTTVVGTMWCAYAFAMLALVALPSALSDGSMLAIIQWISQTFVQLVMLSVIMVGQNIMGKASDTRAEMTYK